MPGNHISVGGATQSGGGGTAAGGGGGGNGSGSGPFASALRSLAIKADTKEDEGGTESGAMEASRDSAPPSGYGDRSRDSHNQPANLSKHSGSSNARITTPQTQDHHQQAVQQSQANSDRARAEQQHLSDERKKKLSPPPEKVS